MMTWSSWLPRLFAARSVRRLVDTVVVGYARRRMAELDAVDVSRVQEHTLLRLIRKAQSTRFGRDHDFARIRSIADYQRLVPCRDYERLAGEYWRPAFPRLDGVTWPGRIPYLALSSGTTSGTTKYIPVSREMLASNRRAALTMLSEFVVREPKSQLFHGRLFLLGGSTALTPVPGGPLAGDLSGIAAREVPFYLEPYRFPPLDLALIADWDDKIARLADASAHLPITMISGVPSWLLVFFDRLKQVTGKATIGDIWPTLRLVIHGGVKFDPYRDAFRREIGTDAVRFMECYPCSEGFIGFEDLSTGLLRLIPDHGIFFEFVPVEEIENAHPPRHRLDQVELGVQYAVVMTTCAGLWSYVVGDTVVFERRVPPLFRFSGRTRYYLSAFGEHLISEEVEQAMAAAASATQAEVADFHVGPRFSDRAGVPGHHCYLIEFRRRPVDLDRFLDELDRSLCRANEDYRAHRQGGVGLGRPEIWPVKPGAFAAWLRDQGKLGGQHKVPRMDNSGDLTAAIRCWMVDHGQRDPAALPAPAPVASVQT